MYKPIIKRVEDSIANIIKQLSNINENEYHKYLQEKIMDNEHTSFLSANANTMEQSSNVNEKEYHKYSQEKIMDDGHTVFLREIERAAAISFTKKDFHERLRDIIYVRWFNEGPMGGQHATRYKSNLFRTHSGAWAKNSRITN